MLLFVTNCKSTKSIVVSGEASDKLSAKQVIKQHQKNNADFKTLSGKVKIELIQDQKEQGHTFNIRIEKDKTIWLSASFGVARMMITPEKVRFYNKIDNEYFDGDYKLLSDFVGVDLDFNRVQNILLGQAIFDLKSEPHKVSVNENSYALQPKDQNALLELFYLINPSHFKMDSLQLFQQLKKRILQVDYKSYQEVKNQILPKDIRIIAVEDSDQVTITMEFKSLTLNEDVRFPFKIPAGYKEIVIK
ncbi:deoxyuridine 5'-triphosphate nucleotidohydrolase [Winogradskyella sp. J14-2]|nr:deoxyuridine 5'-triphosphate nucleotidohydrolase [Winogradskyella sp. J14-2]